MLANNGLEAKFGANSIQLYNHLAIQEPVRACCVKRRLESHCAGLQFSLCSQLLCECQRIRPFAKGSLNVFLTFTWLSSQHIQFSLPIRCRTKELMWLLYYISGPKVISYPGKEKPNRVFSGGVLAYTACIWVPGFNCQYHKNPTKTLQCPLKKITRRSKPTQTFPNFTFYAQLDRPFQNLNTNGKKKL